MYIFNKITVNPQLPKPIEKLGEISENLWWSWNTEFLKIFKEMDIDLWERCGKNPVKFLKQIEQEKENYKFNIIGLFAAGFHKKIGKTHSFYCAEFVKYVMDRANINTNLPEVAKPEDFKKIEGVQEIYAGLLRKYHSPKLDVAELIRKNLLIYMEKESAINSKI